MSREEQLRTAKETDIVSYLSKNGVKFESQQGRIAWYKSFFRADNNASLAVYTDTNTFCDYGENRTGDLIDIVMFLENKEMWEAIELILDGRLSLNINSYEPKEVKSGIEIVKTEYLDSNTLEGYLRTRRINVDIARKYCEAVYVRFPNSKKDPNKHHKCIGFKNSRGGYELRNTYLKVSTSPKSYTHVTDVITDGCTNTFEGFMDFLSSLSMAGRERPRYETFILNGITNITYLHEIYRGRTNYMYVDNDVPATLKLIDLKKEGVDYVDKRNVFRGYKDFNEAWQDDFRRTKAASDTREKLRGFLLRE